MDRVTYIAPKNIPESSSPKVAIENYSPKFLVNVCPKAAVLQRKCSSKVFWKVAQSCSPKLFPEAAPQSCSTKLLSKAMAPKLRFFKSTPQNGSLRAAPPSGL